MSTITPFAPLRFIQERLRASIPEQAVDDQQLLQLVSEGYQRLCEEGECLQTILPVYDVLNQAEYDLPTDHYRTLRVYRNGIRLVRLADANALTQADSGYYEYDGHLGISPTPTSGLAVTETIETDDFNRLVAVGDSWAGDWHKQHTTGGIYSANGSVAQVGPIPVAKTLAQTPTPVGTDGTATDLVQSATFAWDTQNAGTATHLLNVGLISRWSSGGGGNFYRAGVSQDTDGSLLVMLKVSVAGTESVVLSAAFATAYTLNQSIHVKYVALGTLHEVTAWLDGEEEPDPQISIGDSTITTAGKYGFGFRRDTSTTSSPTVSVDDYVATTVPDSATADSPLSWLLYARTPTVVTAWDDSFDSDFLPEFTYAICHYVRWRVHTMIGGEGRVSVGQWEKNQFDKAAQTIRRRSFSTDQATTVHRAGSPRGRSVIATDRTVMPGESLVIVGGNGSGGGGGGSTPSSPSGLGALAYKDQAATTDLSFDVATQTELDAEAAARIAADAGLAPIDSPALTGDPTAPTATPGDADTSIATTAFVDAAITAALTPTAAWMVFPQSYGTCGGGKLRAGGVNWSAGSNRVQVTGGSSVVPPQTTIFTSADTGNYMILMDGTTRAVRQMTYVDSTHVDLNGSAAVTGCSAGNAVWGPDSSGPIQAAADAADAGNYTLGFPTDIYVCVSGISAPYPIRTQGLGGRTDVGSSAGNIQLGGPVLMAGLVGGGTLWDSTFASSTQNGPQFYQMAFMDPMVTKNDTVLHQIHYCTRWVVDHCNYGWGQKQLSVGSRGGSGGGGDDSWGQALYNSFKFPNTVSFLHNPFSDASTHGAGAIELTGGNFNVNGGAVGMWYQGAQYFRIGNFKVDVDGSGTLGVLLDNSGGVNPKNGVLWNIECEKTSNTGADTTTGFIMVSGQTSALDITDCSMGGGGVTVPQGGDGLGHGFGIYLVGSSSNYCEGVKIKGGTIGNGDVNYRFGDWCRNNRASNIKSLKDGVSTLWSFDDAAHCINNRIDGIQIAETSIPADILTLGDIGASSVSNWVTNIQCGGESMAIPQFSVTNPIGTNMGSNFDQHWDVTAGKIKWKNAAGSWVDLSTVS